MKRKLIKRILLLTFFILSLDCTKKTYFGDHNYNSFRYSNTTYYSIKITGNLNYQKPHSNNNALAAGYNLYSIYVNTFENGKPEGFIQDYIFADSIFTIGDLTRIKVLEINENYCILQHNFSEEKIWIIKIFKEKQNKTTIQEYINNIPSEAYFLTPELIPLN
ncbi:hypothetical protein NUH30_19320 [Leptospira sp. 85282-16]|uniref:hypothetical protein n=1 Tax=Leptospira sp. 85282-16 TaxID=2971256 RepID=UPI0021C01156|nr:hypothetical protein [Leptospira sp. 85282-16]MCT8335846.1 hypothetical protein [Leptospira sp. 85282-16]